MSVLESQSPEALALFNPALTATAMVGAIESYSETSADGFPFHYCFLVLPLTLNPQLRESVSKSRRRTLASWCVSNPTMHAKFPHIAKILVPATRQALRHCLRYELLEMRNAGLHSKFRLKRARANHPDEIRSVTSVARTCGRWFAATDVTTAFSLLGVRP